MTKAKVHKALYSVSDQLFAWGIRIFLIVLLVEALIHFNENPIVIGILGLIIVVILFSSSDGEYLILRDDGIIYRKTYWLLWNVDKFYDFKDASSVSVSGDYTLKMSIARTFLPGIPKLDPNEIEVHYKNGESKKITVRMYKNKLIDFIDLANEIVREK